MDFQFFGEAERIVVHAGSNDAQFPFMAERVIAAMINSPCWTDERFGNQQRVRIVHTWSMF